jgi:hypothetical protein
VGDLLDCPYILNESTIPKAGIEVNPSQVVGTLHVGYLRMKGLREAYAKAEKGAG